MSAHQKATIREDPDEGAIAWVSLTDGLQTERSVCRSLSVLAVEEQGERGVHH